MKNNQTIVYMNTSEGMGQFAVNFGKTMSVSMPILMLIAIAIRFIFPEVVVSYNVWTIAVGVGMLVSIITSIIKSIRK